MERGNELYEAGEWDAAGQHYATASETLPEAAEIFYNQGNVLYKQRRFLQALAHYTNALQTVEGVLESRVKYNLGNVEYRRALIAMSSAQDAHAAAAFRPSRITATAWRSTRFSKTPATTWSWRID